MTNTKKVLVTSIILMLLITAGIGTASAAVNIWGADSSDANSQTNAPDYNQKVAEDAKWYYDSEHNILWTEGGDDAVTLPIYLNVTESVKILGYNITFGSSDVSKITELGAEKGAFAVAYAVTDAKISASVSEGNATSVTGSQNIANVTFKVSETGNYSINLPAVKLAATDKEINDITSPADITAGTSVDNAGNVIAFKVMLAPSVTNFTIADVEYRKLDAPTPIGEFGTLYFYQERDSITDGTTNKLNAIIKNKDLSDTFNWKIDSGDGSLTLAIEEKTSSADNFTKVTLTGTKSSNSYNNSAVNITLLRTGESYTTHVYATYWNQSAALTDDTLPVGDNITFSYTVAKVPGEYVTGASDKWDTFVELFPVGTAQYQNYTIYPIATDGYTVTNSTNAADDDAVKNLTVTESGYTSENSNEFVTLTLTSGKNGDSNEDDTVDIIDGAVVGIEAIKEASSATTILNVQQKFLADTDKNGIVNVNDVLSIHEYIVAP